MLMFASKISVKQCLECEQLEIRGTSAEDFPKRYILDPMMQTLIFSRFFICYEINFVMRQCFVEVDVHVAAQNNNNQHETAQGHRLL